MCPGAYIDRSWLQPGMIDIWDWLTSSKGDRQAQVQHLSAWLEDIGTAPIESDFDFIAPTEKRLLLLDTQALMDVVKFLGLALAQSRLRKVVDKSERAKLHSALGTDSYEFLHNYVLPWPRVGAVRFADHAIEQVLDHAPKIGAWALLSSYHGYAAAARRAALKLPRTLTCGKATRSLNENTKARIWDFSVQCIIRNRLPSWHWLF